MDLLGSILGSMDKPPTISEAERQQEWATLIRINVLLTIDSRGVVTLHDLCLRSPNCAW